MRAGTRRSGSGRLSMGGEPARGSMDPAVALRIRDQRDAIDRVIGLVLVFGVYGWGRSPSHRDLRPHRGPVCSTPPASRSSVTCTSRAGPTWQAHRTDWFGRGI